MAQFPRIVLADLSNNNTDVDLSRMKAGHLTGFWHKVSEGEHFSDQRWVMRRTNARRLGLRVGGYHFAHPKEIAGASKQAESFSSKLGDIKRHDLAPVLDLEILDGVTPHHAELWARTFNHVFHELTGVWPLFYSYASFIEDMQAKTAIGRGLWLASYGRNDGKEYPYKVPAPFKKVLAHQFTSNARVPGVGGACDLSHARKLYPLLANGLKGL